MGFGQGFGGSFTRWRPNPRGGGAAAPTADAGSAQTQAGLTQVTLDGSDSTLGGTYAWILTDPSQTNKTSILSDATVLSPTFHPISSSASAGNWTARLAVTKGGKTSVDTVNIRVGDVDGWVTLFPDDAQQSSGSQTAYGTASWGRTGDWTTMTIGDKGAGVMQYPKQCESLWYTLGVDWQDMTSMEFMIEADDSYTQPTHANKVYVGAFMTTGSSTSQTIIPGETMTQGMFWLSNRSETTKFSQRGDDQAFAFGSSGTGYNGMRFMYIKEYYADALDYTLYQKLDTVDPDNAGMTTSARTTDPTGTDKIKIAMAIARSQDGTGVTAKFALKYRLKTRS